MTGHIGGKGLLYPEQNIGVIKNPGRKDLVKLSAECIGGRTPAPIKEIPIGGQDTEFSINQQHGGWDSIDEHRVKF